MAALSQPNKCNALLSRLKALLASQQFYNTVAKGGRQRHRSADMSSDSVVEGGQIDLSKWKKLDSRSFGISRIPESPWIVLKVLQDKGFEAYLVGGCVRDLILNRIPKDFDVITTARLPQIRKHFPRAEIVGRRFPICLVHVKGSIVEVSSFDTVAKHSDKKEELCVRKMPKGCDYKDFILWKNSIKRDFTVNSLFFDPFMNRIYDYADAMVDLCSFKLRTLVPAHESFKEDCARILRGLRLAARLKLSFTKEIENAVQELSSSITNLDKSRLMMEVNFMLSYGAAGPSLSLLRRYRILEILLPYHAAHLAKQASKELGESSVMLMKLFSSLDRLVTCGRPSHDSLWVALLAFHLALITYPQYASVILAFASVLYYENWKEGVKFAKQRSKAAALYAPEISDSPSSISDEEIAERVTKLAEQVQNSISILTDKNSLLDAMLYKFPGSPCSGLVFVSKKKGKDVEGIFDILVKRVTSLKSKRKSLEIDYNLLGKGQMRETRFVLGKVILDTIAPVVIPGGEEIKEENIGGNTLLKKWKSALEQAKANYEFLRNKAKKQKVIQKGSNASEGASKKQKTVIAKLSEEKQDLIEDKDVLSHKLDGGDSVTKKKNKGEHGQLPQRLKLELKEDEKSQQTAAVNHLKLSLKLENDATTKLHQSREKRDSSQEQNIDVQKELDSRKRNLKADNMDSGEKSKQKGTKRTLSDLFK